MRLLRVVSHKWFGLLGVSVLLASSCAPKKATQPKSAASDTSKAQTRHTAPAPAPEAEVVPEVLVKTRFESSAFALRPGGTFWLVARFKIHDGYRISWKNPGDVGQPTRARFTVPEGFSVGEVRYPRPRRFVLSGDLTSYGYRDETALFAQVEVPEGLSEQVPYRFELQADWVACKKQCASESTNAFFELLVDASAPRTAMDDSLTALLESVPVPVSELGQAEHQWTHTGAETQLSLTAPEVEWLDFYPARPKLPKLLRVAGSKRELTVAFEAPSDPPEFVHGIAIAKVGGAEATYEVQLPWGK